MTILLLVRHGENDYVAKGFLAGRLPGIHLNEKGRQQADEVTGLLADLKIQAIYSSPLERALETASPIADKLKIPIITRFGLIEVDYGEWQGEKISRLRRRKGWKTVQIEPSRMLFPNGEMITQAQNRIVQDLNEIAASHRKNEIVVCVSHSDPIKLAVANYIGLPIDRYQSLQIAPASITALHVDGDKGRLITMNYQPFTHLLKS